MANSRTHSHRRINIGTASAGLLLLPHITFAQPNTFANLVAIFVDIINIFVPAIFGIAFVYFTWKTFDSWVLHSGDQAKQAAGRNYALAAIIAFVVMISAWGIVRMLRSSIFGI